MIHQTTTQVIHQRVSGFSLIQHPGEFSWVIQHATGSSRVIHHATGSAGWVIHRRVEGFRVIEIRELKVTPH